MEKIVYLLWKDAGEARQAFCDRLCTRLAPALLDLQPLGLQLNLVDDSVLPGEHMLIENSRPRWFAMVSLWLHTAIDRGPVEKVLGEAVNRFAGYLVTESSPLPNPNPGSVSGRKSDGFTHVVLLQKPPRLSYRDWIDIWHNSHTRIAIDTQSTFVYRQNVVVRPLTYAAPPYDAIIEESFPLAAMTDWQTFYDASGNPELFRQRQQEMMASCQRFIDFDKIDACSTSEYVYRSVGTAT